MAVSKSNWSVSLSLLFCPVWVLFLLFNIIDNSLVWFVKKKRELTRETDEPRTRRLQVSFLVYKSLGSAGEKAD